MFPALNSLLPSWQWGVLLPPLHLFMFIHAQKVSLYLTSYPFASPFSWHAIWPPPPPYYLCLLSHPHLGHPLFSYHWLSYACPMPVPYKHSLCSSRCGRKCKASEKKSWGWDKAWSKQKPWQKSRLKKHQRHICHYYQVFPTASSLHHLQTISHSYTRSDIQKSWTVVQTTFWNAQWDWNCDRVAQHETVPTRAFWRPWSQRWLRSLADLIAGSHSKVGACLKISLPFISCLLYFTMGF